MGDAGQPLIILGIDPGLASTGWGVIEVLPPAKTRLVGLGVIETAADGALATRLAEIFKAVGELIRVHQPAAMVVEQLFFAKNAKTAMAVAHGRAAAILAAGAAGVEVFEFTPLQLKLALTGKGNAGKGQVQAMVKAVLGLKAIPEPNHAADALAAALCYAHGLGLRQGTVAAEGLRDSGRAKDAGIAAAQAARKALLGQRRRRQ